MTFLYSTNMACLQAENHPEHLFSLANRLDRINENETPVGDPLPQTQLVRLVCHYLDPMGREHTSRTVNTEPASLDMTPEDQKHFSESVSACFGAFGYCLMSVQLEVETLYPILGPAPATKLSLVRRSTDVDIRL